MLQEHRGQEGHLSRSGPRQEERSILYGPLAKLHKGWRRSLPSRAGTTQGYASVLCVSTYRAMGSVEVPFTEAKFPRVQDHDCSQHKLKQTTPYVLAAISHRHKYKYCAT